MNDIIAYTNQINKYSADLVKIRDAVHSLFENGTVDVRDVDSLISDAENLEIKFDQNITALHFFYYFLAEFIYKYRNTIAFSVDKCLELCDKDIRLVISNQHIFQNIPLRALIRKSIIMEKRGLFEDAIKACEIGIEYNFANDKASFEKRKEKIIKSMKGGKKNGY